MYQLNINTSPVIFQLNTLRVVTNASTVDVMRLNILRGTNTTFIVKTEGKKMRIRNLQYRLKR